MSDKQRRMTLEFLSKMAMSKKHYYQAYGSSYRFGKEEDGMLAAEGNYWLVQSEKYRVNRKSGKCADHDKGTIDDLLIEWLLHSLNDKFIEKEMPISLHYSEEVPSFWHKEGWNKDQTPKQIVRNLP